MRHASRSAIIARRNDHFDKRVKKSRRTFGGEKSCGIKRSELVEEKESRDDLLIRLKLIREAYRTYLILIARAHYFYILRRVTRGSLIVVHAPRITSSITDLHQLYTSVSFTRQPIGCRGANAIVKSREIFARALFMAAIA